eukprot:3910746-Pleurochrysis_carterae.AAC.2
MPDYRASSRDNGAWVERVNRNLVQASVLDSVTVLLSFTIYQAPLRCGDATSGARLWHVCHVLLFVQEFMSWPVAHPEVYACVLAFSCTTAYFQFVLLLENNNHNQQLLGFANDQGAGLVAWTTEHVLRRAPGAGEIVYDVMALI